MGSPPQVLVVDDYPDTLEMVAAAFECAGYGVLLAGSGREALGLARRHHPAAIVMDICMPGFDGIQTTREIRKDLELASLPVLAHTARPGGLRGIEGLFDAICAKPCPPDRLIDLVGEMIAKAAGAAT